MCPRRQWVDTAIGGKRILYSPSLPRALAYLCTKYHKIMADLSRQQKKDYAKTLYLGERLTQDEIAERVGVSRVTVNRWINTEGWEQLRTSLTITKEEQIKSIYQQIKNLNDTILSREEGKRFATPAEADALNKYATTINKLESDVGLSDTVAVFRKFTAFLRINAHEELRRVLPLLDAFIKSHLNG